MYVSHRHDFFLLIPGVAFISGMFSFIPGVAFMLFLLLRVIIWSKLIYTIARNFKLHGSLSSLSNGR